MGNQSDPRQGESAMLFIFTVILSDGTTHTVVASDDTAAKGQALTRRRRELHAEAARGPKGTKAPNVTISRVTRDLPFVMAAKPTLAF